ncbi:hypothetical protein LS68_000870 [Helicobacter sp. MIT 05-5293]|uniref:hypothetical protein n=1 Tax=Helicobacter sp. MIT 05-5293 TaxID=1548149 RepID=UPI00051D46D4|nr:hypothetical protein [Helicobacter sp. MIT 05-5293]TLD81617.1 hypothetical protein LS68_000870 [Helicobacter sp. MIT 05-5293]
MSPKHQNEDKSTADKIDQRVFEKLLKYNPQSQNLWDIVGIFEDERKKLRIDVAQYHEDIKTCKTTLKELREQVAKEQNLLKDIKAQIADIPKDQIKPKNPLSNEDTDKLCAKIDTLQAKITDLELENTKLCVELRDLRSEAQLQANLTFLESSQSHKE